MPNLSQNLLLQYIRSDIIEQEHCGFVVLCKKNSIVLETCSSDEQLFFLRSCMKPLQATLLVDLDLINYFSLSQKQIAVCCASHVGEKKHIDTVLSILQKVNCNISDLKCPIAQPLSLKAQKYLIKNDIAPTSLHNNCSGKHALMLLACAKNGWDKTTYDNPTHPVQQKIAQNMQNLSGYKDKLIFSKDGCGLPICALPLKNLAFAFLNLFLNSKYKPIKDALQTYPYIAGGPLRLDSEIMFANNNLIAKVGAGGLCVVINLEKEQATVVKIADSNMDARALVTIEALKQLHWLTNEQIDKTPLTQLFKEQITTETGMTVGKVRYLFNLK